MKSKEQLARLKRKADARDGLPNYYNRDKETTSASGKVYYNLQVNTIAKPKRLPQPSVGAVLYFNWVFKHLGLL